MTTVSEQKLSDVLRRVDAVEKILAWEARNITHEATTGPLNATASEMVATHSAAEANWTWLVPLKIEGVIRARRLSAIVQSLTSAGNFTLGLYVADLSALGSKADRLSAQQPINFRLLAQARPFGVTAAIPVRYDADLNRDVVLDPRKGSYFVGYQASSANCRWLVPGSGGGLSGFLQGYKASGGAVVAGTLPDRLTRMKNGDAPPILVVVRSAIGVQLYGHRQTAIATTGTDLRKLILFIDSGPGLGFASGAYQETLGGAFPSSVIWWVSSSKSLKIVELAITRNASQQPTTEVWTLYDADGTTAIETATDTIVYSGAWETNRTRVIA